MSLACLESYSPERFNIDRYAAVVSRFYADVQKGNPSPPQVVTTQGREEMYAITNPSNLKGDTVVFVVEAHPDDGAMAGGAVEYMTGSGITVIYATITDGGARDLPGYTPQQLVKRRRDESFASASHSKVGAEIHLGYQDGELSHHIPAASQSLGTVFQRIGAGKRTMIIGPNHKDGNSDHVAANIIAKGLARELQFPFYAMDTISGRNETKWGFRRLRPTHYLPVSSDIVRKRNEAFGLNTSQIINLPTDQERQAVSSVFSMPEGRGQDIGVPHAAAFFHDRQSGQDILRQIAPEVVYRKPRTIFLMKR